MDSVRCGADLRCKVCGEGATNVAPDFLFEPKDQVVPVRETRTFWTCKNGHHQTHVWRRGQQ